MNFYTKYLSEFYWNFTYIKFDLNRNAISLIKLQIILQNTILHKNLQ